MMSTYSIHQFAEKVALVTDIVSPAGRAVAMQLALQGAFIIGGVPDDTTDSGDLADDLRELGTLASSVRYERSSLAGAEALADAVASTFGRLDLLINCVKSVGESAFLITDAVRDLMAGRPSPRIVDVYEIGDEGEAARKQIGNLREEILQRTQALPAKFRMNGVAVIAGYKAEPEHALFRGKAATEPDDVARVVLFLLSSEAKAVRGELIALGSVA
ncbi:MAG: hypothetical protein KF685_11590 [Acidobacteria bacterium]|nr:hypothetical protein [Acidobacteriota bacterium]